MEVTSVQSPTQKPDAAIIGEVLAGDANAYAELVRRYERLVHAAAWGILRDHHSAQDVAQETFIKAYRQLASLRTVTTFGAWVLAIARRGATDLLRSRRSHVSIARLPEKTAVYAQAEEDSARILSALARLPEHEEHVLLLRYFEDLPVASVATTLHRPVGTVTKQISRGLERLRKYLQETQ
jgi:RNA polymerase sigma-70 factor, ECF subfamily